MKSQYHLPMLLLVMLHAGSVFLTKAAERDSVFGNNRIGVNGDLTLFGPQFRLSYEKVRKSNYWGGSVSFLTRDNLFEVNDGYTYLYKTDAFRASIATRYGFFLYPKIVIRNNL
jgi:hypothetical protein